MKHTHKILVGIEKLVNNYIVRSDLRALFWEYHQESVDSDGVFATDLKALFKNYAPDLDSYNEPLNVPLSELRFNSQQHYESIISLLAEDPQDFAFPNRYVDYALLATKDLLEYPVSWLKIIRDAGQALFQHDDAIYLSRDYSSPVSIVNWMEQTAKLLQDEHRQNPLISRDPDVVVAQSEIFKFYDTLSRFSTDNRTALSQEVWAAWGQTKKFTNKKIYTPSLSDMLLDFADAVEKSENVSTFIIEQLVTESPMIEQTLERAGLQDYLHSRINPKITPETVDVMMNIYLNTHNLLPLIGTETFDVLIERTAAMEQKSAYKLISMVAKTVPFYEKNTPALVSILQSDDIPDSQRTLLIEHGEKLFGTPNMTYDTFISKLREHNAVSTAKGTYFIQFNAAQEEVK